MGNHYDRMRKSVRCVGHAAAVLAGLLTCITGYAANCNSLKSGVWSDSTVWSCAGSPGVNDNATIISPHVVTLDTTARKLSTLTINAGAQLRGNGAGAVLEIGKGGGEDFTNNGTVNFSGATAATVKLDRGSQWAGTGTWNLTDLDLNFQTLSFTAGTTATLNFSGAASPIVNPGTVTSLTTITWNFTGATAQTLPASTSVQFGRLNISNTAGVTLGVALTSTNLLDNLTVASGGVLDNGGFAITLAAAKSFSVQNGATFNLAGTTTMAAVSGGGTKTFGATSTVNYAGANQAVTTETYGNLILSGSGTKTPAAGATTVAGDFTLAAGVTFAGNTNNPSFNFSGNFSNSGTFNAGTGTYTFNGSAVQSIGGSAASTDFQRLTLNNAAGFSLGQNVSASTLLTLSNGIVSTGANTLAATTSCLTGIARTTGYVAGNLQLRFPTGASRTCTYFVGNAAPSATYSPVTVTFASVTVAGDLIGRVDTGEAPDVANSPIDSSLNVNRYWTLTQGASAVAFTTYTTAFTYVAGDNDIGTTPASYIVAKADACGATCTWTTPALSGTPTNTSATATGMTAFSRFVVGQQRAQLNNFLINIGGGTASTCFARTITITARKVDNSTLTNYSGTVSITTSTNRGDWSVSSATGVLTPGAADSGSATYAFSGAGAGKDNGVVALNLSNVHADDLTITVTDVSLAVSSTSATLSFRDNVFVITVDAIQVAGRPQAMSVAMWRRDTSSGNCAIASGYAGNKNLKGWLTRDGADPGGAGPTIGAATLPNAVPGANNVSLNFAAGTASFSLGTTDVGKYALNLRDDSRSFASGVDINGSTTTLTVRPFGLTITGIQRGATVNPGGTATAGARFIPAGETFSATVTARLWQAADDATDNDGVPDGGSDLTDNGATPSYRWATQLALTTPVTPVTGSAGTLGGTVNIASGSFAGGAATVSDLTYSEVGSMTLAASATGFLGTAGVNPSGVSGVVGRFFPNHFTLLSAPASTVTPACAAGAFSYMGHAAIGVSFSIEARNKANAKTTKYNTASYTTGTVAIVAENNNDGTDRSARLASPPAGTWDTGTYAINSSTLSFTRSAAPDGPFAALQLGVRVTDPDSALLANPDMNPATSGDCVAATNCDASRIGGVTEVRFGRLYIGNVSGTARLDLPLNIETQYYTSNGFLRNAQDSCTSFGATAIGMGNFTGNLNAPCETAIETPAGTVSFSAGRAQNAKLRKPGTSNAGSVELTLKLDPTSSAASTCTAVGAGAPSSGATSPASLSYLRGNWLGTGSYNEDPRARATFGIYKNANEFIYFQENF